MRSYIRHPADVPIELSPEERIMHAESRVKDVSIGGLSLKSPFKMEPSSIIRVKIPLVQPPFETVGKVVWCRANDKHFEIGVQFMDEEDAFAARMVEQICHIEHYRLRMEAEEGRMLSPEEAAEEWIGKYASDFPSVTGDGSS